MFSLNYNDSDPIISLLNLVMHETGYQECSVPSSPAKKPKETGKFYFQIFKGRKRKMKSTFLFVCLFLYVL